SPPFTLMVLTLVMPWERIGRFTNVTDPYAISLSRIFGAVGILVLILHALIRRWKLKFGPSFYLYLGYTMIAIAGISWALRPEDARRDALRIFGNLLFFFLIVNLARSLKLVKLAIAVWLFSTLLACVYTTYDYYSPSVPEVQEAQMGLSQDRYTAVVEDASEIQDIGQEVKRAYGPTAHPTLYGLELTMTIPFWFFFMRIKKNRPWFKLLMLGCLALVSYNILLANTRAVILLAIGTFAYCFLRKLIEHRGRVAIVSLLLLLAAVPLIPHDVFQRALNPELYTTTHGASIRARLLLLDKSFTLVQQHWLGGIGVGNESILPQMIKRELTGSITPAGVRAGSHNDYVWTLVESGIFGWLCFFGFVALVTWSSFKAAWYFRHWEETEEHYWLMIACQCVMLGILFFGLQTEVYHLPLKGWWFSAALSVTFLDFARRMAAEPADADLTELAA
ncbi:MAG: O-antigen ligase family protein, partial [Terriglobia bacterium]